MATTTDRPHGRSPIWTPPPAQPDQSAPSAPAGRPAPPARSRRAARVNGILFGLGSAALATLGLLVVVAVILVLTLGGEAGPATGAAELVPGNALIYAHVSTDPSREAVRRGLAISRRLPDSPLLFAAVTNRLDAILTATDNPPVDFASQVRPWLGKEAAFAVLDTTGSSAGSLIVLDVRERARAGAFMASFGGEPDGRFRGVPLLRQPTGAEYAFYRHYLLLGQKASVESAIFVGAGKAPSLASSSGYQSAAAGEPSGRVLDIYASAAGIRRALLPRGGLLGALGILLYQPALSASSISLAPASHGLRITAHSTLDGKTLGHLHSAVSQFGPTLDGALPRHSTLLFDVDNLSRAASKILRAAATAGLAGRFAPLLSRLGSGLAAEGVNVRRLLSTFGGETAVALVPTPAGDPAPVVVTRTSRPGVTRARLAGLEAPLTQLFTPPGSGPGQVPVVNDLQLGGASIHQLALAPGFQLDYTVAHGLVVISTNMAAISAVLGHRRSLTSAPAYGATLADHPDQVTSLVFSALPELLRLGSRLGLIDNTRLATVWPDLAKIRAVGLASRRGELDTTTQLSLQIP
jgi:Protein of unknown function (DUF3352)